MKANPFARAKTPADSWKPTVPPLLPRAVKTAIIGTLSAAIGVGGAFLQYEFSEHNALRQAVKLTQDFDLYTSDENNTQINIKSIFDSRFAFASEQAKESNEFFIRDAVIHRHDLACGRDNLYMKETRAKGQTYLGCSIQAGSFSDGAHINTYAVGDQFSVTSTERHAAEFKEYQLHFTFPRDFKRLMTAVADHNENNALDLARFAIDIYVEAQGQPSDLLANGTDVLQSIAKKGGYFERWILNGSEPTKLLSGLQLLGALPKGDAIDLASMARDLTQHLEGIDIKKLSMDERLAMVGAGSVLYQRPSIQVLNQILDHHCTIEVAPSARDGYGDHNKRCASDLGLQMSPQLAAALDSHKNVDDQNKASAHNPKKREDIILGSYKGHPVISSLTTLSDSYVAYVKPGSENGSHWADTFIAQRSGALDSADIEAGTFVSRKAIEKIHFGHAYDPKHTPIFIDPMLLEGKGVEMYDQETQALMVEKVLEHEIKHILDYKVLIEKGMGTKTLPFEKQQIACDLYAVEIMAQKYDDPRKLEKLRDAMSSWQLKTGSSPEEVSSIMGGADRIKSALDITKTLEKLQYNQDIETVLQFIDQKIEAKKAAIQTSNKAVASPGLK